MQNILLVRLTSMGDIIHYFPAVTDLAAHFPDARIDWLVNKDFVDLPRLHPAVHSVIACAERKWRKHPFKKQTWQEFAQCRDKLRQISYDLVIDSQGLLKSAVLSRLAQSPIAGYDKHSIKELLATYFYTYTYSVSKQIHAIERNRLLTGLACGFKPDTPLNYGLSRLSSSLSWLPATPYIVFLTATSRFDKQWPKAHWIKLGRMLSQQGYAIILPWGKSAERQYCEELAQHFLAVIPPALTLNDAAQLLQNAKLALGVDTGLAHLAAAVNTPIIMLFSASDPLLTGAQSPHYAVNLGGYNLSPSVKSVMAAVEKGLTE